MMMVLTAVALMGVGDPDAIIVTAPEGRGAPPAAVQDPVVQAPPRQSVAHGLTTDEQIESWIAERREADPGLPFGPVVEDDGRIHGMVSVGIGTNGYRNYGGSVSLPVGEGGRLDLHYRSTENDFRRPYGWYDGYRARDPWETSPPARPVHTPRADRPGL